MAAYLLLSLGLSGWLAIFGHRELQRLSDFYSAAEQKQAGTALLLDQQLWLRTGQLQLAEHTIKQHALESLGRSVLEFVARYLDVGVAALYVREDNGDLRRVAAYGFSASNESATQAFGSAESLVGQAALENRVLRLDNLPEGYLKVSSGLGQASPRHVLQIPVHNDGQVNGVVELGFLRELGARDLEFVNMIANNIGNSIHAALYRRQLQDVLAESQQLNEDRSRNRKSCATSMKCWKKSRVRSRSTRSIWKISRQSWSRPTNSCPNSLPRWTRRTARSTRRRLYWKSAPKNSVGPAATRQSF